MSTFTFDQLTTSEPGFTVSASITVNGGLSNLPTLSVSVGHPLPTPIDFGNLTAFSIQSNGFFISLPPFPTHIGYTLADFTNPTGAFPFSPVFWSINPSGITFIDQANDFIITGLNTNFTTIHIDSDSPVLASCLQTGNCFAAGIWVPEPSSMSLVGAFLLVGLVLLGRCRRRNSPECSAAETAP